MTLREQLLEDMKTAMRAKDSASLAVIRYIQAHIKQQEVDQRITLDDVTIVAILQKLVKQREQAISEAKAAAREDLVAKESFELSQLQHYLPKALSEEALEALIQTALKETGSVSPKDMGKVMAMLKERIAGRADMRHVSERVKALLSSL